VVGEMGIRVWHSQGWILMLSHHTKGIIYVLQDNVGKPYANIRMITTHFEPKDLEMRLAGWVACKWRNGYEAGLRLCPSFGIIFK